LDSPLDREVYLRAWSGRPPVGSVLQVRYRRSNPGQATDARVLMPWPQILFGLGGGLVSAIVFWATWRRNLLDQALAGYNKITIWLWVRRPFAGRATHRD
jgi:hypothetical protein